MTSKGPPLCTESAFNSLLILCPPSTGRTLRFFMLQRGADLADLGFLSSSWGPLRVRDIVQRHLKTDRWPEEAKEDEEGGDKVG